MQISEEYLGYWPFNYLMSFLTEHDRRVLRFVVRFKYRGKKRITSTSTCDYAARNNYIELMTWLNTIGAPWDNNVCVEAAGAGHLGMLRWLIINNAPYNVHLCARAATIHDHIDILEYIEDVSKHMHQIAAGHDRINVIKWLLSKKIMPKSDAVYIAAKRGNIEILEIYANIPTMTNVVLSPETFNKATASADTKVLDWLLRKNAPMYRNIWIVAVRRDNVKALEWLKDNDIRRPDNYNIWREASMYGHVNVLEFASKTENIVSHIVYNNAVYLGYVHVLEWLKSKNEPYYDDKSCQIAAREEEWDTYNWLVANGAPVN